MVWTQKSIKHKKKLAYQSLSFPSVQDERLKKREKLDQTRAECEF